MNNLLSNAIKLGHGKPIEILVGMERGVARLAVRDHGIGIDPKEVERIFGRCERAVSERHYGGLGLGLYISRWIVEEHGGSIRCREPPRRRGHVHRRGSPAPARRDPRPGPDPGGLASESELPTLGVDDLEAGGDPDRPAIRCGERLEVTALPGLPLITAGDDLAALVAEALGRAGVTLQDGDVVVVASKVVSRAEGRFVDLSTVEASQAARTLAVTTAKDARLCELILRESQKVSRVARGALVTRHRLGHVYGDAGIDASNARPEGAVPGSGPWAPPPARRIPTPRPIASAAPSTIDRARPSAS